MDPARDSAPPRPPGHPNIRLFRENAEDADAAPTARAHGGPAPGTVRAPYCRYRHPARCRRPVRAAASLGISCLSPAWGARRRRYAHLFLKSLTGYQRLGHVPFSLSHSLCEVLHIRDSLPGVTFHSATLWVEGNRDVNAGESAASPGQLA